MKYKVGDKVRVRSDLKERMGYGCQRFTDAMKKQMGKIVTISNVVDDRYYYIKEDNYNWTDEMLEPVEEELTAEEAIRLRGEMCEGRYCSCCKLSAYNNGMADCYAEGVRNAVLCSHFGSDDHHIYDQLQKVLVKVITIVMNYED